MNEHGVTIAKGQGSSIIKLPRQAGAVWWCSRQGGSGALTGDGDGACRLDDALEGVIATRGDGSTVAALRALGLGGLRVCHGDIIVVEAHVGDLRTGTCMRHCM